MSKSAEARVTDDELYVAASPRLLVDLFHGIHSLKVHNVGDLTKEPRMVEGGQLMLRLSIHQLH